MSDLAEFIDEHDLSIEDVIDALDIDPANFEGVAESPTDFYDGEPAVEALAEDFDAVDLLVDEKESLENEVDSLRNELREARRPVFADRAERLVSLTEKWGDEDELMAKFDAEDEDERWTLDDVQDRIKLAEDIIDENATTTTVNNDDDEETGPISEYENASFADEDRVSETSGGKLNLSSIRD